MLNHLVIAPSCVECLQEVVVQRREDVSTDLGLQVKGYNLLEPRVQPLAVFVKDHRVRIPVEFFKAEPRIILSLNLLDGVLEKLPNVLDELLVHRHWERPNPHLAFFLGQAILHHYEKLRLFNLLSRRQSNLFYFHFINH